MDDQVTPQQEPLSRERLEGYLVDSPFHQMLGLKLEALDEDSETLTLRVPFSTKIERGPGSGQHHGGVIASLIDIAGDFALIWRLGAGVPTINFRTDYLRPAFNTDLIARARVRRIGRTIGVCDIDVFSEEEKLLAIGRGCYGTQPG